MPNQNVQRARVHLEKAKSCLQEALSDAVELAESAERKKWEARRRTIEDLLEVFPVAEAPEDDSAGSPNRMAPAIEGASNSLSLMERLSNQAIEAVLMVEQCRQKEHLHPVERIQESNPEEMTEQVTRLRRQAGLLVEELRLFSDRLNSESPEE